MATNIIISLAMFDFDETEDVLHEETKGVCYLEGL
uniref:Uncharacterized protein n=1 Tax=Arundo donax TaxID=35708 RepID=A0A0A8Y4K7_ARUDO